MIALAGAIGAAVSALADPLGIGEGHVFGWLQITGVVVGAVMTLLGLVVATEWIPLPWRTDRSAPASSGAQTTVVTSSDRD